ncbi:MAG: 4Fe-4S dicluster domain-containing protein [Candidatus Geothermincolia bacterium]
MEKKIIVCDSDKCSGCELCEYACSIYKEGTVNWSKSRIRHIRVEPISDIAMSCRKCESPLCIRACPRDAVSENADGSIAIDKERCNGCGWCIEACAFGALKLNWESRSAVACDFCADNGGKPRCVEVCPYDALEFTTLDAVAHDSGKRAFLRVIEELD